MHTIKLKIKIFMARWLMCHCHACVGKKWSKYQKKGKHIVAKIIIVTSILIPTIDGLGSKKLVFENPTVTTAEALTVRSEVIETSSVSDSYTDPAVVQGDIEKLVRAICLVESNCESNRVGDGGKSFGAFQIYLPAHPNVTKEQAMDFEWAKQWTINHCKAHINNPPMFAKCHNGIAKTTNQWYVDRVMDKYGKL